MGNNKLFCECETNNPYKGVQFDFSLKCTECNKEVNQNNMENNKMSAIERHRKTWGGKSDEWIFERLDNELKDKIVEIHSLLQQTASLQKQIDEQNTHLRTHQLREEELKKQIEEKDKEIERLKLFEKLN